MTLSYGKTSPHDILAKAERDLARLEGAEAAQDEEATSDAVFDLAVALTSLKDWLKEHPGASFSSPTVESYVAGSTALSSFRDIANVGKHRVIRMYEPQTVDVAVSVTSTVSVLVVATEAPSAGNAPKPLRRIKIIRADGSRHRATDLGRDAVREWGAFMQQHGV